MARALTPLCARDTRRSSSDVMSVFSYSLVIALQRNRQRRCGGGGGGGPYL